MRTMKRFVVSIWDILPNKMRYIIFILLCIGFFYFYFSAVYETVYDNHIIAAAKLLATICFGFGACIVNYKLDI